MSIFNSPSAGVTKVSANYTTNGESYIGVLTASASANVIITVSTNDIVNAGGILVIKDEDGNANDRNITVVGEAGQQINNQSASGIVAAWGTLILYFDGSGEMFTINNVTNNLITAEGRLYFNNLSVSKDLVTFENALTLAWDGINTQFQLKKIDPGTIDAYYNGEFIIDKSRYPISTGPTAVSVSAGGVYLTDAGALNTTYNMDSLGDGNNTFNIQYVLNTQNRRLILQAGMRTSGSGGPYYAGYYMWQAFV